jgi:uncharacterized membrane protein YdjX (TVP38/TMEM64 family)
VGLVVLVTIISGSLIFWREPIWELFSNQQRFQEWVEGFGPWAPAVSIVLNAAQVLLAPIPGQIVGFANGYLYGTWMGTLYSMIGLIIGRALAMALGRWFGRGLVERLVKNEQLERWDALIRNRGPFFIFLIFLFPLLPDDAVCFLIGLTQLSIPHMLLLSALGGLPGVFVSCWAGANALDKNPWMWIPLGAVGLALALLFRRYEARLEAAMGGIVQRLAQGRVQTDGNREPEPGSD